MSKGTSATMSCQEPDTFLVFSVIGGEGFADDRALFRVDRFSCAARPAQPHRLSDRNCIRGVLGEPKGRGPAPAIS